MKDFANITCPNCLTQYRITDRIEVFWDQFPHLALEKTGIHLCPYCAMPITTVYETGEYWLTDIDLEVDEPDSQEFVFDLQSVGLQIGIQQLFRVFRPELN
jgi:uncharacterized Zn-finger protein